MNRLIAATGAVAALAIAACGSSGSAAGNATSSSTSSAAGNGQGAARLGRNGAAGELVQINGTTLVLNTTNGDVTVNVGGSTPVTQTRTGTVADIVVGSCIVATGNKDSSGAVTASTVRVSPAVNGSCAGPGLGAPGGQPPTGATPRAEASPNPSRTPNPNAGFVRGLVTAVSGTTVTVRDPRGGSGSVTVPTTVRVTTSSPGSAADLTLGQCVAAVGSKDSAGVVSATALSIVPAGPSGCFTGGNGRGFGGFGGGFRGGSGSGSSSGQAQPAD